MESFSKYRRIQVLAGPGDWCRAWASTMLTGSGISGALWLGEGAPADCTALRSREARRVLGREFPVLVVDAHAGLDPEALGAASGTVVGGGWLLLLTPPLNTWADFPDPEHERIGVAPLPASRVTGRFLGRLARVLREHGVAVHTPERPPPGTLTLVIPPDGDRTTPDQQRAVQAVLRLARGRARRPLVLTAHRGRGKSAALGMAAAELASKGNPRILVTAPRRIQVESLLTHAGAQAALEFRPPDALLRERPAADLLLVDEAAAIPTPLLTALLRHYPRIAFATTVHGYEGTGRGFALRFRQILDRDTPGWRELGLETPIRWGVDDPVERLIFRMLLLDAEPVAGEALTGLRAADCRLEPLEPARLADDEATLGELFGLLILAHYQTTPLDLRYLMDGPNVGGFLLRHREHVVGVALTTREGGLDAHLARAIRDNRRRPRGHLLPQTIAAHLGRAEAVELGSLRVMRIAVHPAVQGRGLGKRLLAAVLEEAVARGVDMVGSSFGATPALLGFWAGAGLQPVRLGFRRDAASGEHSALVLRGTTAAGEQLNAALRARFLEHLPTLLTDPLRDLAPALAAALLTGDHWQPDPWRPTTADRRDLEDFTAGRRGYEDTLVAVRGAVLGGLGDRSRAARLGTAERDALVLRVVQGHDWATVAARLDLPGKAAVAQIIRQGLARLLA